MTRDQVVDGVRAALRGLAWVGVVGVIAWQLAQWIMPDATFLQAAAQVAGDFAGVPLLAFGIAAAVDRNLRLAAVASVGLVLHIGGLAYLWGPRTAPEACGPPLTIVSANLLMVHPNPKPLFDAIAAWDADVYVLQEYSPRWDEQWQNSALRTTHPHGVRVVQEDSFGSAIGSRVPVDAHVIELGGVNQTVATLALGKGTIEIVNVHVLPPRLPSYLPYWRDGLATLVERERNSPVPFVVTGDFNASPWSGFARQMHTIADDAWELVGTGPGFTWPNGVFFLPPARIDHVFVSRDLTVTSMAIGDALGSDHAPLKVQIAPRRGGSLCP